jgi:hypothetical protein
VAGVGGGGGGGGGLLQLQLQLQLRRRDFHQNCRLWIEPRSTFFGVFMCQIHFAKRAFFSGLAAASSTYSGNRPTYLHDLSLTRRIVDDTYLAYLRHETIFVSADASATSMAGLGKNLVQIFAT